MGVCGTRITSSQWHLATKRPRNKATDDVRRLLRYAAKACDAKAWGGRNGNTLREQRAFIRWVNQLDEVDSSLADAVLLGMTDEAPPE